MLLAIDIGNTRTKAAVYEDNRLIANFVFQLDDLQINYSEIISAHPKITDVILSSVANIPDSCNFQGLNVHTITHRSKFPFHNMYATPETLGIDRMILAAGAILKFPKCNRLVIDAGTCITYDFIDSDDKYYGGAISPGIRMRYQSLEKFTAKLPLLTPEWPDGFTGNSTSASMHSGVINGVIAEISAFIEHYENTHSNFIIILTGGDTDFLAKRFKNTIFANSNFLLDSMNQTFQYTIKND